MRPAINISIADRYNFALNKSMNQATKICGRLEDAFSSRMCTMIDIANKKTRVYHTESGGDPNAKCPAK